uniref:Uncharacterized protein n=1 Tax=Ciona savignyi TaxID=51511 RepID=H2YK88_CIOSA
QTTSAQPETTTTTTYQPQTTSASPETTTTTTYQPQTTSAQPETTTTTTYQPQTTSAQPETTTTTTYQPQTTSVHPETTTTTTYQPQTTSAQPETTTTTTYQPQTTSASPETTTTTTYQPQTTLAQPESTTTTAYQQHTTYSHETKPTLTLVTKPTSTFFFVEQTSQFKETSPTTDETTSQSQAEVTTTKIGAFTPQTESVSTTIAPIITENPTSEKVSTSVLEMLDTPQSITLQATSAEMMITEQDFESSGLTTSGMHTEQSLSPVSSGIGMQDTPESVTTIQAIPNEITVTKKFLKPSVVMSSTVFTEPSSTKSVEQQSSTHVIDLQSPFPVTKLTSLPSGSTQHTTNVAIEVQTPIKYKAERSSTKIPTTTDQSLPAEISGSGDESTAIEFDTTASEIGPSSGIISATVPILTPKKVSTPSIEMLETTQNVRDKITELDIPATKPDLEYSGVTPSTLLPVQTSTTLSTIVKSTKPQKYTATKPNTKRVEIISSASVSKSLTVHDSTQHSTNKSSTPLFESAVSDVKSTTTTPVELTQYATNVVEDASTKRELTDTLTAFTYNNISTTYKTTNQSPTFEISVSTSSIKLQDTSQLVTTETTPDIFKVVKPKLESSVSMISTISSNSPTSTTNIKPKTSSVTITEPKQETMPYTTPDIQQMETSKVLTTLEIKDDTSGSGESTEKDTTKLEKSTVTTEVTVPVESIVPKGLTEPLEQDLESSGVTISPLLVSSPEVPTRIQTPGSLLFTTTQSLQIAPDTSTFSTSHTLDSPTVKSNSSKPTSIVTERSTTQPVVSALKEEKEIESTQRSTMPQETSAVGKSFVTKPTEKLLENTDQVMFGSGEKSTKMVTTEEGPLVSTEATGPVKFTTQQGPFEITSFIMDKTPTFLKEEITTSFDLDETTIMAEKDDLLESTAEFVSGSGAETTTLMLDEMDISNGTSFLVEKETTQMITEILSVQSTETTAITVPLMLSTQPGWIELLDQDVESSTITTSAFDADQTATQVSTTTQSTESLPFTTTESFSKPGDTTTSSTEHLLDIAKTNVVTEPTPIITELSTIQPVVTALDEAKEIGTTQRTAVAHETSSVGKSFSKSSSKPDKTTTLSTKPASLAIAISTVQTPVISTSEVTKEIESSPSSAVPQEISDSFISGSGKETTISKLDVTTSFVTDVESFTFVEETTKIVSTVEASEVLTATKSTESLTLTQTQSSSRPGDTSTLSTAPASLAKKISTVQPPVISTLEITKEIESLPSSAVPQEISNLFMSGSGEEATTPKLDVTTSFVTDIESSTFVEETTSEMVSTVEGPVVSTKATGPIELTTQQAGTEFTSAITEKTSHQYVELSGVATTSFNADQTTTKVSTATKSTESLPFTQTQSSSKPAKSTTLSTKPASLAMEI